MVRSCFGDVTDDIPSEIKLTSYDGDLEMVYKLFWDSHMLLAWGLYIFFWKKIDRSWVSRIDVLSIFWKYISRYSCYDVMDHFGESEIERRCGKILHLSCLWCVGVEFWIDVRVVFRWFQPYPPATLLIQVLYTRNVILPVRRCLL